MFKNVCTVRYSTTNMATLACYSNDKVNKNDCLLSFDNGVSEADRIVEYFH